MKFIFGEIMAFITDKTGKLADILTGGSASGTGQSTHGKNRLATQTTIVGKDGVYEAEVALVEGFPSLRTFGIQAIESLKGFDPIADTWFFFGNETDATGAGNVGDTVRVQIAAGSVPASFPAIDLTYTLVAEDVGNEEQLATNVVSFLNANATFSTLWRAQKVSNSGTVYITSKKPGSQFERPNVGDFQVTTTGTTVVTIAFNNIIRRNKVTSLARDPSDPRQGILGIQGSVVQTEGDVTNRFQTVHSNLLVNGSVTPVEFTVDAHATEVRFVTSVTLFGRGNGIQFGKFLSQAGAGLTNGLLISFKSNDFSAQFEPLKTTDDIAAFFAQDPDNFSLYIQSGGDFFIATLEFGSPLELRPVGEFVTDDFFKITVRDNLTSGITQLRAVVNGFNREF